MGRYQFWFHGKDKKGRPLDENLLKAAEELAPMLTRYRQQEIDCESTCNDILQEAVEATSDAMRRKPIANVHGYITTIYKRNVDKSLDHDQNLVPVDDEFLEDLANTNHAPSFEEWIHERLILDQVFKLMDPYTERICRWRLEGYSESQIAKRLRMTPNAVSVRYTRGLKEAAKELLRGKGKSKRSDAR